MDMELSQIKQEQQDEYEHQEPTHSQFTTVSTCILANQIKKEKSDECYDEVIYESLPWEQTNSKNDEQQVRPSLEFNENMIIKTEIEVEAPVFEIRMEQLNEVAVSSKAIKPKKKSAKPNKTNNKITNRKNTIKPPKDSHQCEICCEKFPNRVRLISHHRRHTHQLPFGCRVCLLRFSEASQRAQHESNCGMRRFECHLCRFTSLHAHWNRFMVHIRKHTGDKPFSCKCCAKQFSSKRMLNFHMKYHPNENLSKCSFCQKKFTTSSAAKEHEFNCSLNRKMECYLCKSLFTYRSSLKRHMPQHTGLTAFNCKYCKMGYVRKEYLDLHMKTKHTKELAFVCSFCELRFSHQSDADNHMQRCNKKTIFKCDLCDYTTVSKTYADDHKQKHDGSDEFKCWHCSEVFLQRSKLVHHVKSHNKKSKFECPHCKKGYHRWLFMEKHRKICTFAPTSSNS